MKKKMYNVTLFNGMLLLLFDMGSLILFMVLVIVLLGISLGESFREMR